MTNNQKNQIVTILNRNTSFNMFGICNIGSLKSSLPFRVGSDTLIHFIQKRFNNEMVSGIQFIGIPEEK